MKHVRKDLENSLIFSILNIRNINERSLSRGNFYESFPFFFDLSECRSRRNQYKED